MIRYIREYTFHCFCGRQVHGSYHVYRQKPLDKATRETLPLDREQAVCRQLRGKAGGQPRSSTDAHDVGCGRSLADCDREREEAEAKRRELAVAS